MRWQRHLIALGFCTLIALSISAQNAFDIVDRQKVEELVNDASLASFYPTLLERFNAFDSTLTLSDYRLLYYGFVFQPNYSWKADQHKKEMNKAMQAEQYVQVMQIADLVLQSNPVSLTAHYFRTYAMLNHNENDPYYQKYIRRYTGLKNAILSSGDGQHCNTGYKTIYLEDEDEIMYHNFEMDHPATETIQYGCHRFSVSPSGTYPQSEIYFDISESLLAIQKEWSLRYTR